MSRISRQCCSSVRKVPSRNFEGHASAHCLARIVPGVLTIASPELLPALGREGWHATGEHGDEDELIAALAGSGPAGSRHGPRPGRRIYGQAVCEALILLWEASDRVCGK